MCGRHVKYFSDLSGSGKVYTYNGNLSEAKIHIDRNVQLLPDIKALHKNWKSVI